VVCMLLVENVALCWHSTHLFFKRDLMVCYVLNISTIRHQRSGDVNLYGIADGSPNLPTEGKASLKDGYVLDLRQFLAIAILSYCTF